MQPGEILEVLLGYMAFIMTIRLPLKAFMCATAILKIVSLSGFRASAEHVGTISDSSVMYAVILFRLRRSISQWFSRLK